MILDAFIMTLILQIAPQYDVPPYLIAAIIIKESDGNPNVINRNNENGTIDRGLMQLNSSWFNDDNWDCAETNIRAGCQHLRFMYDATKAKSPYWWAAIVSYNCGLRWHKNNSEPPVHSINYANSIIKLWFELDPMKARLYGVY